MVIVCTTKVRDKTFRNTKKDTKTNHSVSSPPYKVWGTFFVKKLCMGNEYFWANLWENVLHGD